MVNTSPAPMAATIALEMIGDHAGGYFAIQAFAKIIETAELEERVRKLEEAIDK